MNKLLKEELLKNLNGVQTISEKEKEKIYRCLPIPNDYHLIFAEIKSKGGYPVGIAFTEEALIYKASRQEVRRINKNNTEQNKKNKQKRLKVFYRIIPWEYFDINNYELKEEKGEYSLWNPSEQFKFTDITIFSAFLAYKTCEIKNQKMGSAIIENASLVSVDTINAVGTAFGAKFGSGNSKTGHGLYAEEAGSVLDKLSGEQSTVVGYDNAPNGPDKIVNSFNVQCKYCADVKSTINNCFENDDTGGQFRYWNLDGTPMQIEVPKNQYTDAIELMKDKIRGGKVGHIIDEKQAYNIIREGKLTYEQARNLAKAGTIESITFDVGTGAVKCLSAFGISALFAFSITYISTKDFKKSAKAAFITGLNVYGISLLGSILSAQLARTSAIKVFDSVVETTTKVIGEDVSLLIINSFRKVANLVPIEKQALSSSTKRFLSTNALTSVTMFVFFSIPDTYKVINKNISKTQYVKNIVVRIAGIAGGKLGVFLSGTLIGRLFRQKTNKNSSAIIGFVGGTLGSLVVTAGTILILDLIIEDDAVVFFRMFDAILRNCIINYMLSEEEQVELVDKIAADKDGMKKLLNKHLYTSKQAESIEEFIINKINEIVAKREKIRFEDEEIINEIVEVINKEKIDDEM